VSMEATINSGLSNQLPTGRVISPPQIRPLDSSAIVKWTLVSATVAILTLLLLVPLAAIFTEALRKGWEAYASSLVAADFFSAVKLTLFVTAIAVPLNLVFGLAASW